jgi:DNA polymerase I-like protein with 3'-5' exonuclease and polymerase domains
MYGAVTLQPDLHKSLGRSVSLYLDCRPWKTSNKNMSSPWRMLAFNDPRRYSAKDSFYTAWMARVQIMIMKKLGTWDLFMGQNMHPGPGVMATIPTLTQMTLDGIPLNVEYAKEWCPILERHQLKLEKLWAKHFGTINPHAAKQLQKLFHGQWGLPLYKSRKDTIMSDELALVSLSAFVETQRLLPTHKGPWKTDPRCNKRTFDLILRLREISKLLGTYVMPVFLEEKPKVHPQYLPVSKDNERGDNKNTLSASKGNTATGRLAANNPNIANQPKRARVLYVPEGDHCFIQADYKSAELYVQGALAGDRKLLRDLKGDMHQMNANMLGCSRDVAKNVIYASQYLATPTKQSEMILKQAHMYVSPAECYRISTAIWEKYSDTTAYKNHLIELCDTKRFLMNPFKRPRAFHDGRSAAAVNFIPQSTVADILWCVLKPVAEVARKHGGRMYTTVYDSILIAVPKENREAAAREMRTVMQQRFNNIAPDFYIPVEIEWAGPGEPWSMVKKQVLKEAA